MKKSVSWSAGRCLCPKCGYLHWEKKRLKMIGLFAKEGIKLFVKQKIRQLPLNKKKRGKK